MNITGTSWKGHFMPILLLLLVSSLRASAQTVSDEGAIHLTLPDGVKVTLLEALDDNRKTSTYYYLPTNLHLSVNEEGSPEFLLMLWSKTDPAKVDDGIMHWLFTWGLTKNQEKMLDSLLITTVDSTARLLGAVIVEAPEKYLITGENTELANLLKRSMNTGGGIPTLPGGKTASSFRFTASDAPVLAEAVKDPGKWKHITIEMPFYYYTASKGFPQRRELRLQLNGEAIIEKARKCKECFIGI